MDGHFIQGVLGGNLPHLRTTVINFNSIDMSKITTAEGERVTVCQAVVSCKFRPKTGHESREWYYGHGSTL